MPEKSTGFESITRSSRSERSNGYFIFGKNNPELVCTQLDGLHLHRYETLPIGGVKFNWITRHTDIDWRTFDSNWQILNHIQNEKHLSNKGLLVTNLRNHHKNLRPSSCSGSDALKTFLPETYLLDNTADRITFKRVFRPGSTWICKPVGLSCGREVFLFRTEEELTGLLHEYHQSNRKNLYSTIYYDRLVQKYVETPLLIHKHKFDIRTYLLCVCLANEILCFAARTGYLRLSMHEYDLNDSDRFIHLTNQSVQVQHDGFAAVRNQTGMTMEEFNEYFNAHVQPTMDNVETNWVMNELPKRIAQILTQVADSVRAKLTVREGCFGYYGVDILIDEQLNCWLLEVNSGPTLDMTNAALKTTIPMCLNAAIQIVIEALNNYRSTGSALPLRPSPLFQYLPPNGPSTPSTSIADVVFASRRLISLTPGMLTPTRRRANRHTPLSSTNKSYQRPLMPLIPAPIVATKKTYRSTIRHIRVKRRRKNFSEQLTEIIRKSDELIRA